MNKKGLLLFLGLVLPVLIFVFLKLFGRNQFDVPMPYRDGVTEIPAGCSGPYAIPYILDAPTMRKIAGNESGALVLVKFGQSAPKLESVTAKFTGDVLVVAGDSIRSDDTGHLKKCVLLMKEPFDLVLIDHGRNIRGYYDGTDRDDLDRLEAELTIILGKY